MNAIETGTEAPQDVVAPPGGPGARLKSAREQAGLSLDQAAQALKLSSRQVRALEEEDFASLPGRTFARGFVRNYARLVNLDADDLLAELPDATRVPALASPSLHSTGSTIAEVPPRRVRRPTGARWALPLVVVACVLGGGAYEWYRGGVSTLGGEAKVSTPAPAAAPIAQGPAGTARTELENPLANAPAAEATPGDQPEPAPAASAAVEAVPPAPAEAASLRLTYRGPSWTEIRDARGQVLLARLVAAGSEQEVRGSAPFDVTIGNARAVTLAYGGKPVDLTRYTRQSVARLRLP